MNETLSIATAHNFTFSQKAKRLLGGLIASVDKKRAFQLAQSPVSAPSGVRDKAVMAHLKHLAMLESDTEFFERLHQDFWKGQGGAEFSTNCDHRFEDLFLAKQAEDFQALRSYWEQYQPQQIVEFGCNSGLLLNYLVNQLDGVESATGVEINARQVEQNKTSDSLDRHIQFECANASKWLPANGQPKTLFVTNGGVLEYFPRESLDKMLSHISKNLSPSIFFSVEPIANDHDWSLTTESLPFGTELSFSHNYRDLFNSNGFKIQHQRRIEFAEWTMVATIAVTKSV